MESVQSPVIPIVAEWISAHPGTISLGQGVVHYPPPAEALEALARFGSDPMRHRYGHVAGHPELLAAIATKLQRENHIATGQGTPSRIVVTAGGNMAFINALLAITDPGDEVIIQTPYYFNHEMAVTMANVKPVLVPTRPDYQLDPAAIERAITPRTRAVVTISPNNPTGAVYPESDLRAVNELCGDRNIHHIHDEAYEYFTFGGRAHFSPGSIQSAGRHTISLYSLSKAYGFASWRIGYMVIPEHLLMAVKKVQDTILICPPLICQFAALGALEVGAAYARRYLAELDQVRRMVYRELERLGSLVDAPRVDGAFYVLARIRTGMDAMALTERLIREHRVAVIPGSTFGVHEGCSIRIAYGALRADAVTEGIGRLVDGLGRLA
ncbi:MAG: pyridoxal phosphate-dependent aminotransferase [Phycisphaeraceae bacterium]|nr:pyridoxal phosphate-dependent aminotransferase [Phycisphaeraceae bacterium]